MSEITQTIESLTTEVFELISTAQRNGMNHTNAITVGIRPLLERLLDHAAELASLRKRAEGAEREAVDRDGVLGSICYSLDELRDCIGTAPEGWRRDKCLAALAKIEALTLEPGNALTAAQQQIESLRGVLATALEWIDPRRDPTSLTAREMAAKITAVLSPEPPATEKPK